MPLSTSDEKQVTGEGYYTSSIHSARSLLGSIADEIDDRYYLEVGRPDAYGYGDNAKVFKVTITVEEV